MLKLIPMTKPEEQERLCLKSGIIYDKSKFAYGIYEDGEPIGASQFYIENGVGYISDFKITKDGAELMPLTMLLGRSVLNFLDLNGVKEAVFQPRGEYYDSVARVIGFKEKDGKHYAYLEGMFTSHEH